MQAELKQKLFPGLLLSVALVMGQTPAFAEAAGSAHEGHHASSSLDWPGLYLGLLPCADCVGIKTSLALNKNNSYILITQYAGKSEREFVEKGKFSWGDKENTIVLTPKNGSEPHYYEVGKDVLTKLDNHGNRISGKNADSYVLRRTDVTGKTEPSHGGH